MELRRSAVVTTVPALLAGFLLHGAPASAQQNAAKVREQAVAKQLADSEARVRQLQQRIERLENRLDMLAGPSGGQPPTAGFTSRQAGPPPARMAGMPPASALPPQPARRPSAPTRTASAARPGSFEVDEDAAQRALERTLTQSGALLLPQGAVSLTPGIDYTRNERRNVVLADVVDPVSGANGLAVGTQTLRRNEFTPRLDVRVGLPMQSQLEVGLPYNYVRSSRVDSFGTEESANGDGFGDISIGLAKTLAREKGGWPDLIGRLTYGSGTGRSTDGRVGLGSGYRQLAGELVALKRQDPLAFFASASYGHVFEDDNIRPGAVTNLSIGTVLAASPATSLQFGFTQTYRKEQKANGVTLKGSDETYGMVSIGASSVLSRDVMLLVSTGIGVGGDAPDYSFNVSLPISFR